MVSLKKNFAYQIAYQILIVILPLITSPYLSRIIGAQGLGEYSYSYSIAYYFSLFILLGVNNHGTREIANIGDDKKKRSVKFWSIYVIQLTMGAIIIILYVFTQILGKKDNILSIIQLLYIFSSVLDINWLFFGLEKFKITVTRNFIIKIFTVLSIFLFVKDANDVAVYTFIMAFGFLMSQILIWPFAVKEISIVSIHMNELKENVKPLLILFIPVVAVSIFKYMDKIMLGVMCSKSELGLYDNSEKIMSIPTGLITAIGTVMLPRITNMMSQKEENSKVMEYLRLSISGSMVIAAALTFGLAAIAPTFAPWFWGEEFTRCGLLIKVIAPSILFLSWASVIRTQYLIPNGKDTIFVKATIYGAVVNFVINYALIGRYGAMGTVIGTVVAEGMVALYQTMRCRKELPIGKYMRESIPYFMAGLVMYIAISVISRLMIGKFVLLFLEVLIGGIIYTILLLAYFKEVKKIKIKNIINFIRR